MQEWAKKKTANEIQNMVMTMLTPTTKSERLTHTRAQANVIKDPSVFCVLNHLSNVTSFVMCMTGPCD